MAMSAAVGKVRSVEVRSGGYVDHTTFHHHDGQQIAGGSESGAAKRPFVLKDDEYIQTVVYNHANDELHKMQLVTNTGRKSEVYGGKNCLKPDITVHAPPGQQIVGLKRSDTNCSKIDEVIMADLPLTEAQILEEIQELQADESELWESWSVSASAHILVDGQQLHQILIAIKKQMDSLRKKQFILIKKVQSLKGTTAQQLAASGDGSGSASGAAATAVAAGANADDVRLAFEKIRRLELMCNELNDRMEEVDGRFGAKLSSLQGDMRKISARIDNNSLSQMEVERKVHEMEEHFAEQLLTMRSSFDQKLAESEQKQRDTLLALEARVSGVSDVVDLNDHRLRLAETKLSETAATLVEVKDNIDTFPERHLDSMRNSIVELYMDKASRADLARKADDTVALMKADQTEVTRIEELCDALNRKINFYGKEMQDGFSTVDARMEKRMDKIAHWALRYLKREMKNLPSGGGGGGDDQKEGTDIGRVRCLVCDQEVNQQRVTDIVFGGPAFKASMQPQHRRSPSPPPAHPAAVAEEPQQLQPLQQSGRGAARGQRQPLGANVLLPKVGGGPNTHSKLVKGGAEPNSNMLRLNSGGNLNPELEYITDFNFRIGGPAATAETTSSLQQQQQQVDERKPEYDDDVVDDDDDLRQPVAHSSSAPLLQVKNPFNQQPVGSGAAAAAAAANSGADEHMDRKGNKGAHKTNNYMTAQEENQQYFRELEDRFTGGRRQNNSGALRPPSAGAVRSSNSNNNNNMHTYNSFGVNLAASGKRPSTAPIKRTDISRKGSGSVGKLKSTGRPIDV